MMLNVRCDTSDTPHSKLHSSLIVPVARRLPQRASGTPGLLKFRPCCTCTCPLRALSSQSLFPAVPCSPPSFLSATMQLPRRRHSLLRPLGPRSKHELRVFDPSLIDTSVDPCDNFYQFSAATAGSSTILFHPIRPRTAASMSCPNSTAFTFKQILENAAAAQPQSRNANEQKIGDEYASCMDTAAINQTGHHARCSRSSIASPALKSTEAICPRNLPTSIDRRERLLWHGRRAGLRRCHPGHQLVTQPAAWACPSATTTPAPMPSPSSSGKQYVDHVTKMFVLAANPAHRPPRTRRPFLPSKPPRQGIAHRHRAARPAKPQSPHRRRRASTKNSAISRSPTTPRAAHAPASGKDNDTEPKFFTEFNSLLSDTPLDSSQDLSPLASAPCVRRNEHAADF